MKLIHGTDDIDIGVIDIFGMIQNEYMTGNTDTIW